MYSQKITLHFHYFIVFMLLLAVIVSFSIQELMQLKSIQSLKDKQHITVQLFDISKTTNKKYPHCILLRYWSEENPLAPYIIKVWSQKNIPVEVGQEIVIKKPFIQTPNTSLISYFKKEKILAHVFVKELEVIKKTDNFSWIHNKIFKWRQKIHSFVIQGLKSKTKALMESLFFGLKNNDRVDHKPWQYWGISHYLARSGLHLVVLLALLMPLLILLPIGVLWRSTISMIILLGYYLLSWSSVSFMRAVCMFIFGQLCFMQYLPIKTTHAVLLIAALFLIINPYYLLFADFQLSFGLTFALATFLEYSRKNSTFAQQESIAS